MLLEVSETSAKDVEFGVGYSTERGLRGFVEYADKNVFNFGGKGSARAELSIERPKLTLQYLHPHVGTQDTQLVASVFNEMQRDNDSFDLEERGMRLGIRHHFDETLSLSVGYYFQQTDPSNVKEAAKLSSLDTEVLNLGGVDTRLFWDVRDDLIQPRKGGVAQLYLRSATYGLGSETNFFELRAQTSWYLRVLGEAVLACSLSGHLIEPTQSSQHVPIYTRYFLGGDSSVRGFDKHQIGPKALNDEGANVNIGGDRLLRINTEFRFPIYSVIGGVVFYDAGANWLHEDGFEMDHVRDAIGGGLRIATPVGPLRLDYGWKLDRKSGESAGEYYITIGSAF
jgi:outer membrane protein insertion porin family